MPAHPGADDPSLLSVASSIAEGVPVDWDRAAPGADDTTTAVLDELRVLEGVLATEPGGAERLGPLRPPRRNRPRLVRHGLPCARPEPEPRSGAEGHRPAQDAAVAATAPRSRSGAERGQAAGEGQPSQRRSGLQRRTDRPGSRRRHGAAPRPHSRRPRLPARPVRGPRGDDVRRRHLLRTGGGARRRPGPRRRQGPERDAGLRRTHGADGLRGRLRPQDRQLLRPPPRRHAALSGAGSLRRRGIAAGLRRLQRRGVALLPGHRCFSGGGPHRRRGASQAPAGPRRAACSATPGRTSRTPSSTSWNGPRRSSRRIVIRPPASSRPHLNVPCAAKSRTPSSPADVAASHARLRRGSSCWGPGHWLQPVERARPVAGCSGIGRRRRPRRDHDADRGDRRYLSHRGGVLCRPEWPGRAAGPGGGHRSRRSPVAAGDQLGADAYVYVVNEDDRGNSFLLFPLPGLAPPIHCRPARGTRFPDWPVANRSYWRADTAGGREHFLIFASPQPLSPAFQRVFDALPRPSADAPVVPRPLSNDLVSVLRGVGGLAGRRPRPPLGQACGPNSGRRSRSAKKSRVACGCGS